MTYLLAMDSSTIALSLITVGLAGYVAYESFGSGTADTDVAIAEPVGSRRRGRRERSNTERCRDVKIGSPDFARCANDLGAARNIIAGNPENVAHNINTSFVNDEYAPKDGSSLGNAFMSADASNFGNAFPFTDAGNTWDDSNDSTYADLPAPNAFMFMDKSSASNPFVAVDGGSALGAAVSPSAMGASKEEIMQSTKRAVDTTVSSNTGGNLNLLHPLE